MPRPNPEGWKGGSEDFSTVWTLHGHRSETPAGLFFDCDNDPEWEGGITEPPHPHIGDE
jgi:hypothetical protein